MEALRERAITGYASMATAATAPDTPKDAEPATMQTNAAVLKELNFADREDFEDAQRGLITAPADGVIKGGTFRSMTS
jgi:alkyl sulfatase BDS1-like metallo-beta-lactamase superfamily hydrolase